ncbi:MAG: pyrophosphate--fructose-6-phosphate 1-phosphotransferase [Verrucomicrobiales bacterium]|jgi:pyrophosphate--fructose-6-phosphate 1-phosphotransferase
MPKTIAFLTAGGIAPCLSASIGALIEKYREIAPDAKLIGYLNGYQGLLKGKSLDFPPSVWDKFHILYQFGGSALGNSRVKLTNDAACVRAGLVKKGEDPLKVAADQLVADKVDILHTIGGDDTNTTAADLAKYLEDHGYGLTVVGLPKTVDNDVFPIRQTLGALTAAEEGARFFQNIANENTTASRQLIVHEVMGRSCGWLTARTALDYHTKLKGYEWLPELNISRERWDVDAIWLPEIAIDFEQEYERLRERMERDDKVHVFLSEGAGTDEIILEIEASGEKVERDAFGHAALDKLNPGAYFSENLSRELKAGKTLVQKSGYFGRSAKPNAEDLELIKQSAFAAAGYALEGKSGVAGLDEDNNNEMSCIAFPRIKGHKKFDLGEPWFQQLLGEIGQPNYPKS